MRRRFNRLQKPEIRSLRVSHFVTKNSYMVSLLNTYQTLFKLGVGYVEKQITTKNILPEGFLNALSSERFSLRYSYLLLIKQLSFIYACALSDMTMSP